MTDYSDDLDDLIDAAIARDIMDRSTFFYSGGYWWKNNAEQSVDVFPAWRGSSGNIQGHGSTVDLHSIDEECVEGVSPASIYETWENRVHDAFDCFNNTPEADDFNDQLTPYAAAEALLAIQPETFERSAGDGKPLGFKVTGNDDFTLIASASTQFGLMQGLTSDAFRKYFLDRFPLVTERQYAITQMLHGAVAGEKLVWQKLGEDVPTLISEAREAFETQDGQSVDWGIVGVIAGIAGLVPGLGTAAGATGAIAGALGAFPEAPEKDTTFDISGGDVDAIWSSVSDAVEKLKELAKDQEETIGDHLTKIKGLVAGNPELFDLNRIDDPTDKGGRSESDEFGTATDGSGVISDKGVMNLDFDIMIQTGKDLKQVSHVFHAAASKLDGALSIGPWLRDGSIGAGGIGHFSETSSLNETLVSILLNTEQALQRGGDVVQIAAQRIKGRDEQVEERLAKHKKKVDAFERAENAPPPSPSPPPHIGPMQPI